MSDVNGKPLEIRPHHGLCTAFFRGEGYSGEFTENMGRITALLTEKNPRIVITDGADEICRKCPELSGEICSGTKAERYDRTVMELCGFSCGMEMDWQDFSKAVHEKIISCGKLQEVCGDCQWFGICGKLALTLQAPHAYRQ